MEKGKIIVIEGTDCSGKETQSKLLIENLKNIGEETVYYSFPAYDTPSGRIVGLPYLGKSYLAKELVYSHEKEIINTLMKKYDTVSSKLNQKMYKKIIYDVLLEVANNLGTGWFPEGAPNVDPKISSLYYAADRAYNIPIINKLIEEGTNVILDRYIYSNLAHQGGKIEDDEMRKNMYDWNFNLEFNMLNLPESDIRIFLHMPTKYANLLKKGREEAEDENERDINHLLHAEKAYIEVANMFDFHTIECVSQENIEPKLEDIKSKEDISKEVFSSVKKSLHL